MASAAGLVKPMNSRAAALCSASGRSICGLLAGLLARLTYPIVTEDKAADVCEMPAG